LRDLSALLATTKSHNALDPQELNGKDLFSSGGVAKVERTAWRKKGLNDEIGQNVVLVVPADPFPNKKILPNQHDGHDGCSLALSHLSLLSLVPKIQACSLRSSTQFWTDELPKFKILKLVLEHIPSSWCRHAPTYPNNPLQAGVPEGPVQKVTQNGLFPHMMITMS